MEKVAPSERFRSELDEVLAGVGGEEDPIETVGRLGARLILAAGAGGRGQRVPRPRRRYERAEETVSHRNGYEPKTVRTTSGAMRLERPRIRDASKLGFESRILGKGVARTHALESLVISGFLRGLSTRDVEAALEEVFEESIVSKSTVSRICEDTLGSDTGSGVVEGWRGTTSSTASWTRLPEAASRRHTLGGRPCLLGSDAGGPQDPARIGSGKPREL